MRQPLEVRERQGLSASLSALGVASPSPYTRSAYVALLDLRGARVVAHEQAGLGREVGLRVDRAPRISALVPKSVK